MSVGIHIQIDGKAGEYLSRFQSQFGEGGRRKIEASAARSVAALVQRHLFRLHSERHATAKKLGATPTNVIGSTAENVSVRQNDNTTAVVIPHRMFRRAFQNVEIAPRTAKALAIPVAGEAYDKAPRSFAELFVWSRKSKTDGQDDKGAAFLARRKGDALQLMYLLRKGRIEQKQDRSLLPGDEEMSKAAKSGISAEIRRILARKGGAA